MALKNKIDTMKLISYSYYSILIPILIISSCYKKAPATDGKHSKTGKYISLRGFKMYYEEYGSGMPLLMIHCNGGTGGCSFEKNIVYFAKNYRVIVPDSRAQGKSADPRDSLSFEMMADDYAALLDSLHIDSAYVIGWSDGGINALELAMRHPSKVKKLIATGASLWPDSTAVKPEFWKMEQEIYNSGKGKIRKTTKQNNDWSVFMLDWQQPNISLASLKQIKCAAMIVSGDHDLINLEHTLLIYKNIPNAQLWVLPNSGHATLVEYSNEFNRKSNEFFHTSLKKKFQGCGNSLY
jgi:pimeloyl-ACP methyl ester carboxylesterase